jgi:hypothetical protein
MTNCKSLPEYQDLLKRISFQGGRILAFVGSGLSQPNGLPAWAALRDKIADDYLVEAQSREPAERDEITRQCTTAKKLPSLWNSFNVLKKARGPASFEHSIKRHLGVAEKLQPPQNYERIWKIGVHGIITLNIDGFSQKAYSKFNPGGHLEIFSGIDICNYTDAISRETQFVCNLHGILGNPASWVFTADERKILANGKGFREFFSSCFLGSSVVFLGITAEDVAAGGILERLVQDIGVKSAGDHYWLTDRSDAAATEFSDKIGLKRIKYAPHNNHIELDQILDDLSKRNFRPPPPSVVIPPGTKSRNYSKPSVQEVLALSDPNLIRKELNEIASNILRTGAPSREHVYKEFIVEYDQAIHSAWYIPKTGRADFFDYRIERLITSEGAFGAVYEARNSDGKHYAIKILHEAIRDNTEMQDAFRRGVSSMQILAKRGFPMGCRRIGERGHPARIGPLKMRARRPRSLLHAMGSRRRCSRPPRRRDRQCFRSHPRLPPHSTPANLGWYTRSHPGSAGPLSN